MFPNGDEVRPASLSPYKVNPAASKERKGDVKWQESWNSLAVLQIVIVIHYQKQFKGVSGAHQKCRCHFLIIHMLNHLRANYHLA